MNSSTSSSRKDSAIRFVVRFVQFGVLLFVVLELFFRFILPASEMPRAFTNNEDRIRRFDSEYLSEGEYTYGRYCKGRFHWRINEAGWNSIFDYSSPESRNRPLIAILGDSYLEGFYSDPEEHIDAMLYNMFGGQIEVYTFAMSGVCLSQCVAICRYVEIAFQPDMYVIFVNSRDIQKSIVNLAGSNPIYFQIRLEDDGSVSEIYPVSQSRSSLRDIILRSSIIRYLRYNAGMEFLGKGDRDVNANIAQGLVNSGRSDAEEFKYAIALQDGAEYLVNCLIDELDAPVLFVSDGPRDQIYMHNYNPPRYQDCLILEGVCKNNPHANYLDLIPVFADEYIQSERMFNFSDNSHWNQYGSSIVAEALYDYLLLHQRLLIPDITDNQLD